MLKLLSVRRNLHHFPIDFIQFVLNETSPKFEIEISGV